MRVRVAAGVLSVAVLFSAPGAVAAPLACGDLGGTVREDTCQITETTPGYMMDLRFPVDYPGEPDMVNYVAQTKEGFLNVARTPESRGRPYELDVTAESLRSAQTRSVVLTLFQNVGGAHPTTWYKSFTYDVGRNAPVAFETLFAPGAAPMAEIFPIVQRELENTSGLGDAVSAGDGMDPAHYQNFAITDDAVIFYFGRGELLPSYAGATSVSVPRAAIPPLQV
ncbi:MAG TPA: RsiV family protein [Mycobacterium sp.]|nr:RsiV family protein [Mycobacterium sp.]